MIDFRKYIDKQIEDNLDTLSEYEMGCLISSVARLRNAAIYLQFGIQKKDQENA